MSRFPQCDFALFRTLCKAKGPMVHYPIAFCFVLTLERTGHWAAASTINHDLHKMRLFSDMRLNFACLIQTLETPLLVLEAAAAKKTLKNLWKMLTSVPTSPKCRKYGAKSLISILLLSKVTHVKPNLDGPPVSCLRNSQWFYGLSVLKTWDLTMLEYVHLLRICNWILHR